MRIIINALSILGLIAAPITIGMVYSQTHASQVIAVAERENFPDKRSRLVDFRVDEGFKRLSDRQQLDQLRDWLLFTILSGKGLSVSEINQSTYDVPVVRYGYVSPVSNFEYGTTRSAYIGDGRIVALIPKATSKEQRIDDLAHIADRHRKDQGVLPQKVEVFEYEIAPDEQSAFITRQSEVDGKQLFSSVYGYHEASIQSLDDLQRFMERVDDLTFADASGSSLTLGGRKIKSRESGKIRVEEVAALWQSEKKIQESPELFKKVNGSGFSLDPNFDYSGLEAALEKATPLLQSLKSQGQPVISDQDIQQAKQELSKNDIRPYSQLIERVKKIINSDEGKSFFQTEIVQPYKAQQENQIKLEFKRYETQFKAEIEAEQKKYLQLSLSSEEMRLKMASLLQQKEQELKQIKQEIINKSNEEFKQIVTEKINTKVAEFTNFWDTPITQAFQKARYDGDLQGTEVGMVLFYTDLLAKLWALDYLGSTPSKLIPDFQSPTQIKISSIYKKEIEALPNTRLWFGTQDRGFQVANEGNNLLFARNATRVYALSSNQQESGIETTAAPNTEAFLNWWNDHYEEVARYEPQYERLNQIMKWSLAINWLNQSSRGTSLGFLQRVSIQRDYWFADWVKAQGERLKFQQWDLVSFFDRGYKGIKTETMPSLRSEPYQQFGKTRTLSGGVSLANRSTFRNRPALPITSEIGKQGLRSNLNYGSIASAKDKLTFKTLGDEVTYSLKNTNRNLSETTAEAKPKVKFRSPDAEVANKVFSRSLFQTFSGVQIQTSIGGTELGTFSVNQTRNGFTVDFLGRDLDDGHSLGLLLSRDKRPIETVLKGMEDVQFVLKSNTQSPDYIVKLNNSKRWLKTSQIPTGGDAQSLSNPPEDWQYTVGDLGDNSRNLRLSWIDEKQVKQGLNSGEYKSIFARPSEPGNSDLGALDLGASDLGEHVQNLKYKELAKKLQDDSMQFFIQKTKQLKIELKKIDGWLKVGKNDKAVQQIDNLIKFYGSEPDLVLRKAVVDIRRNRLNVERIFPDDLVGNLSPSNNNFLDEITGLLGGSNSNLKVRRIETDTAFIYVQVHPKLNNLDFKIPIEQSVPSGSEARVYKLQPGVIGKAKVHTSGLGDTSASSHASTQFQGSKSVNALRQINQRYAANSCDINSENENNEDAKCPKEKPVYVIIMPGNS